MNARLAPINALTITQSHAEGTRLEGTRKGDGAAGIVSALGWRWWRDRGTWYVPRSRDQHARHDLIDATRSQLQRAGHQVDVHVDERARDFPTIEADLIARRRARAARLDQRASVAHAAADAAAVREDAAAAALPPVGEPIKVGHHSEGRHRSAIDRAWSATGARVEADEAAARADQRASAAAAGISGRTAVVTVANRLERLGAELRREQRAFARFEAAAPDPARTRAHSRLRERVAVLEQQIGHWTTVREEQISTGAATNYGPRNVRPGDRVRISGSWYPVVRANRKSVTVPSSLGDWTQTAPWHHVTHNQPAQDQEQNE